MNRKLKWGVQSLWIFYPAALLDEAKEEDKEKTKEGGSIISSICNVIECFENLTWFVKTDCSEVKNSDKAIISYLNHPHVKSAFKSLGI